MALDGVLAYEQSQSDLSVAEALRRQLKNLDFARREAMNGIGVGDRVKIGARPSFQPRNLRKGLCIEGVARRTARLTVALLHSSRIGTMAASLEPKFVLLRKASVRRRGAD